MHAVAIRHGRWLPGAKGPVTKWPIVIRNASPKISYGPFQTDAA